MKRISGICLLAATLFAMGARAQGFDAHSLHLAPMAGSGAYSVPAASADEHLSWEAGGSLSIAHGVLVHRDRAGEVVHSPISDLLVLDVLGGVSLWERLSFGVALPVFLASWGDEVEPGTDFVQVERGGGLGDLRLLARGRFWSSGEGANEAGFHVGGELAVIAPTGNRDKFQGGGFQLGIDALAEYRLEGGTSLHLRLGYLMRPQTWLPESALEVDDALTWGLAVRIPVAERLDILADVHGEIGHASASPGTTRHPMEALVGVETRLGDVALQMGVGRGLSHGFGAPAFRALLGARYSGSRMVSDWEE